MGRRYALLALFLLVLSCSPEPSGIVDNSGTAPVLRDALPAAIIVDSDSILVGPDRLPEDVLVVRFPVAVSAFAGLNGRPVASVIARVTDDAGGVVSTEFSLRDDGLAGDSTSGDDHYGGVVAFSIQRVEVGTWNVRVMATATNGTRSTTVLIPVKIVRNNRPPVLSALVADTSVSTSSAEQLTLITVKAIDPDGQKDLRKVYFDSYLPSGQAASGNPFQLFDDGDRVGVSGDQNAGDSLYSIRIQFTGATPGQYRFEFRAVDRSSDTSNVLIHRIRVTP